MNLVNCFFSLKYLLNSEERYTECIERITLNDYFIVLFYFTVRKMFNKLVGLPIPSCESWFCHDVSLAINY